MICYKSMIRKAYLIIETWRFTMSSVYTMTHEAKWIANSCRNIFCAGSISSRSLLSRHWSQQYLLADQTLVSKRSGNCLQIKYKTFCTQVQILSYSKRESYDGIFLILQQHKIIFLPKFWENIEPGNVWINPARICPFHLHTFVNVIVRCNFLPNGTFLSNRMISSGNFYPVKIFLMGCFVKWNTLSHFPCRVFFLKKRPETREQELNLASPGSPLTNL